VLHEDNKPKFELEYDWADEFVYDHSAPDDWEDYSDTSLGGYCEYNDTYSWHEDWYEFKELESEDNDYGENMNEDGTLEIEVLDIQQ